MHIICQTQWAAVIPVHHAEHSDLCKHRFKGVLCQTGAANRWLPEELHVYKELFFTLLLLTHRHCGPRRLHDQPRNYTAGSCDANGG